MLVYHDKIVRCFTLHLLLIMHELVEVRRLFVLLVIVLRRNGLHVDVRVAHGVRPERHRRRQEAHLAHLLLHEQNLLLILLVLLRDRLFVAVDHDPLDLALGVRRDDARIVNAVASKVALVEVILTNHHILSRLKLIYCPVKGGVKLVSRVVDHAGYQVLFPFMWLYNNIRLVRLIL